MKKEEVCVLIPAYNQENEAPLVAGQVKGMGFPVLVVDDGSTDRTCQNIQALGFTHISYKPNQGKGAALRKGIDWFLDHKEYTGLVMMDADGQHDAKELTLFYEALENGLADIVVGNRMTRSGNMPRIRWATNFIMSKLISLTAGQKIPDSQCGYRAMKREVLEKIQLRSRHFEIESELLLEASRHGFKTASIPIACIYKQEISHINPLLDTGRFFLFLAQYFFRE